MQTYADVVKSMNDSADSLNVSELSDVAKEFAKRLHNLVGQYVGHIPLDNAKVVLSLVEDCGGLVGSVGIILLNASNTRSN